MTISEPIRPLTPQQLAIAQGIADGKDYEDIGRALTPPLSPHTVRAYVRAIALILDEPRELPPRWRIFVWMKQKEWQATRTPE